jgi:hypothetical protein
MESVRNKVEGLGAKSTTVGSARTEDAFWRKFTLPQEDRDWPWDGVGYRWFRSPNIVPLEQHRRRRKERFANGNYSYRRGDGQ